MQSSSSSVKRLLFGYHGAISSYASGACRRDLWASAGVTLYSQNSIMIPGRRREYSSYLVEKYGMEGISSKGHGGRSSDSGLVVTIFGCTGLLGRTLTNTLGKAGYQIVCPHRGLEVKFRDLKPMGDLGQINLQYFDVRDYDSVLRCVENSDVVINLICGDYNTSNFTIDDMNHVAARAIARAAKESNVSRFIYASCLSASLDNPYEFFRSKALGEKATKEEFPGASIVRMGTLFGYEDFLICLTGFLIKNSHYSFPVVEDGVVVKRPIHVKDAAKAIERVFRNDAFIGQDFELFNPNVYTYREIIDYARIILAYGGGVWSFSPTSYEFYMKLKYGFNFMWRPFYKRTQIERLYLTDEIPSAPGLVKGFSDVGINNVISLEDTMVEILNYYRTKEKFYELWTPITSKPTSTVSKTYTGQQ